MAASKLSELPHARRDVEANNAPEKRASPASEDDIPFTNKDEKQDAASEGAEEDEEEEYVVGSLSNRIASAADEA